MLFLRCIIDSLEAGEKLLDGNLSVAIDIKNGEEVEDLPLAERGAEELVEKRSSLDPLLSVDFAAVIRVKLGKNLFCSVARGRDERLREFVSHSEMSWRCSKQLQRLSQHSIA